MPATPAKTVANSPKQNTPKSAKKPMTPKMEKKNTPKKPFTPKQKGQTPEKKITPNKAVTPKQNGKSPLKKLFTPKQNGQTSEKKITPQKRKSDANVTTGETVAKKQKTDNKPVPNMESALTRIGNKEQHVRNPEQEERTIYVGNVPITATVKELNRFFALFGTVESFRLCGLPEANPKLPKKVHANRKSLQCYVVYRTAADAIKALEANGTELKGHHLRVDKATRDGEYHQKKAIYITNLPFDTEEDDVWTLFQDCGDIRSVRLIRDKETRIGKGLGYVNFKSADAVKLALQMEDIKMGERDIRVSKCSKGGSGATSDFEYDQKKAIFIGNLLFDAEEDDVWTLFQDCGDIRSVRLIRDKETRIGKGFGFVNFNSADAVELALQMEDIKMGKRDILVRRCSKGGSGAPGVQINKRNADKRKKLSKPALKKKKFSKILAAKA